MYAILHAEKIESWKVAAVAGRSGFDVQTFICLKFKVMYNDYAV